MNVPLEELTTLQTTGALLFMGMGVMAFTLLMAPVTTLAASALAWVDDKKYKGRNPLFLLMARAWGYKPKKGCDYAYTNGAKEKYTADLVGISLIVIVLAAPITYLAVKFYEIPMGLALLYAIAHTARFARRHKKLFDEHVKDPEAHK